MASIFLKFTIISLVLLLIHGCNPIETESDYPGVSIYKTKGDYLNLVTIGMKGDEIFRTSSFWNARYNSLDKLIIRDNDTIYPYRYKLPEDYILDAGADLQYDVFLDLTFKEYLRRELTDGDISVAIPDDTLRKHILEKEPFIEFYQNRVNSKRLYIEDSLEIKKIILNGEIDKYFEKLK